MTERWLVNELERLSPAQLVFRTTPDSWSITDVVEHLSIAEPQDRQMVLDSMKQPPTTEKLRRHIRGDPLVRDRSSPNGPNW